jgi:lysophospholipase L1-like esterase
MIKFRYIIGSIISVPLLPILYFQGKNIRKNLPQLPEATGIEGLTATVKGSEPIKLLVLGESTVAGVGVETHEKGFAGTLAKELSCSFNKTIDWKVYARSGYTAKRVQHKIVSKITEQRFHIIVIGLGGNDAFTLNSPKKWAQDIQNLINELRIRFGSVPIYFTNMPPIKEFPAFTKTIKFVVGNLVELLGEQLQLVVKNNENVYYNSEVITINGWTKRLNISSNTTDFFSDGVHPSEFTYQVWAKEMATFISAQK